MMISTIDVETSYQKTEQGGMDPLPFNPKNILVSVGINDEYYFTNHSERVDEGCYYKIQAILDQTTLLIGHNIKFDLSWLLECGFKYNGDIYDTMIYEYLKAGGRPNIRVNLSACCDRRGLPVKQDVPKYYLKEGLGFESMPWDVVEEYGRNDVNITWELYKAQIKEMKEDV